MNNKNIKLVFTAARGWKVPLAYIIRYLDDFVFSHVGVLDEQGIIWEATFSHGVRMSTLKDLEKSGYPFLIAEVPAADYSNCINKAISLNGSKYDVTILGYQFLRKFPLLKWLAKKPISKNGHYDCAAHVANILHAGGVSLSKESNFKLTTIKDIYLDPLVLICRAESNRDGISLEAEYTQSLINLES